jgi:antitoxin (DNA-binding transcriptional repressor) of toxin-antitoxin stability system
MATIHMSETEAAGDFAGLMNHVRAGSEVVIESGNRPVAVIRSFVPVARTVSESIRLSEEYAREVGYKPVMDADFAADMREIIANRKPRDRSAWEGFDGDYPRYQHSDRE